MTKLIHTDVGALSVPRLGESHTICVVFAGSTIPNHVKVGYMRYPVWECKPGHYNIKNVTSWVASLPAGSMVNAARNVSGHTMPISALQKPSGESIAVITYDATSPACPCIPREREICKLKSHEPLTYVDSCNALKAKRREMPVRNLGA